MAHRSLWLLAASAQLTGLDEGGAAARAQVTIRGGDTLKEGPGEATEAKGAWVAQLVEHLPSAQVMIPGSWDGAWCQALCSAGSLLLPLPAAPPACALSNK